MIIDADGAPQAHPEWLESLDRADADLVAGRFVDGRDIHRELRAAIDRLEATAASRAEGIVAARG